MGKAVELTNRQLTEHKITLRNLSVILYSTESGFGYFYLPIMSKFLTVTMFSNFVFKMNLVMVLQQCPKSTVGLLC